MQRKIFCLMLALLLSFTWILSASADAIIPPEKDPSYQITTAHRSNGDCKALNVFLSNFVEAGVTAYDQSSPDSLRMAVALKHLELNAKLYTKDVKKIEEDGKTYMRVSASAFEKRVKRLFDKSISAADCPGYEDGKILVSAQHFGGPIRVFASVTDCTKEDASLYKVLFNVYQSDKDISDWYRVTNRKLPTEKLTLLGSGEAMIGYKGGETTKSISSSDFTLVSFTMDVQEIPCNAPNLPYGIDPTQPPTEAPAEAPVPETLTATGPASPIEEETVPVQTEVDLDKEGSFYLSRNLILVVIIVLVLVLALLALVIILLAFKKK